MERQHITLQLVMGGTRIFELGSSDRARRRA